MKRVSNAEFEQMIDEITRQVVAKMKAETPSMGPRLLRVRRRTLRARVR
jgi:hypothetical protein